MVPPTTNLEWVTIKTTLPKLPYPPFETRPHIKTGRLLLRPLRPSDADELHGLRSQAEVMVWTSQGKPDVDLEATKKVMTARLPNDMVNYDFAICLAETGKLIGTGGSHMRVGELGWPVLGYMFRKDAWGKGYASEFLNTFIDAWWALPREEVNLKVDSSTVGSIEGEAQEEVIIAVTVENNPASQNVLRKSGFQHLKVWEDEDPNQPGVMEVLYGFGAKRRKD